MHAPRATRRYRCTPHPDTGPPPRGGACRASRHGLALRPTRRARARGIRPARARQPAPSATTRPGGAPRRPASRDTTRNTYASSRARELARPFPFPRPRCADRACRAIPLPRRDRSTCNDRCGRARRPRPATPRTRPAPLCVPERATSRRASPRRRWGGTAATTTVIPSSNAATTAAHRSGATHRTTANRSSSTPAAAAARAPSVPPGSTTAAHSPAAVAAAASVSATVVAPEPGDPSTAIVLPRCSPPAGSSSPSRPVTGSSRSPAATNGRARAATARRRARASSSRRGADRHWAVGKSAPRPRDDGTEHTFDPASARETAISSALLEWVSINPGMDWKRVLG